jgi:hypothetical protein
MKNSTFCKKVDDSGLAFEKGIHVDFHQFTERTQIIFFIAQ